MFNVERVAPAPASLNRNQYNTKDVVDILEPMFHGKCYLCEQDELSAPEIEHFDPHMGDENKKYNWANLYYSCARCNSIKGTRHTNLLDCCDNNIDVLRGIKCLLPSCSDSDILISTQLNNLQANNTVELLNRCYNEKNTPLRGITRAVLMDKLFELHVEFQQYRLTLKLKKHTPEEKAFAKARLTVMIKTHYPFSVFWRWHVLSDSFLSEKLDDVIDF
jgi:uncharacterized protein (TIGR02646 family)